MGGTEGGQPKPTMSSQSKRPQLVAIGVFGV
jgi:hypothetical protein